jgi:hypothetical protein
MPETTGSKKGTPKKVWIGAGAASVAVFLFWRYRTAQQAAAATGLAGGTTIPAPSMTGPSPAPAPSNLAGWVQQALSTSTTAGYQSPALLNDINSWLNGQCVSGSGYNVIGQLVETLGVPPGYQVPPSLAVCPPVPAPPAPTTAPEPSTPTTTPATPAGGITAPMWNALDQAVGALSGLVGRGSSPAQLSAAEAAANAQHLDYTTGRLFEQEANVGVVSSGLKTPSVSSIVTYAAQLAGGTGAYSKLSTDQQRYYNDLANAQLLRQMNPRPAAA